MGLWSIQPSSENREKLAVSGSISILKGTPHIRLGLVSSMDRDARADVAAKEAVNANLAIDALDWSDLDVRAGVAWSFSDTGSSGDAIRNSRKPEVKGSDAGSGSEH